MTVSKALVERFMRIFQGNKRGHGYGRRAGVKRNDEKNKWEYNRDPKYIGWAHQAATFEDFEDHLNGITALGIAPLFEDGMVPRVELDLDKEGKEAYGFDYEEVMQRLTDSGIPFVASRTKSSGIRASIFFSENVEAELARRGMEQFAARLGYAGNEIFPKQTKLESDKDAPNWTFLPYGPTFDVFAEQCGMSNSGKPLQLEEYIVKIEKSMISREQFLSFIDKEETVKEEARKNGKKKNNSGLWIAEETEAETIKQMFCDGPPCMWTIAHNRCTSMQNNFLLNVSVFLKRKYPDNWEQALDWVNMHVLKPAGSIERIATMKKEQSRREYEYGCQNPPIVDHCNPYACRKMKFGVGCGSGAAQHRELGMTIWNSVPQRFIINVGEHRMPFASAELLNQNRYREKCLDYGVAFPSVVKREDWDRIINQAIEEATIVDPPDIMRTNATEIEILEGYFATYIPNLARQFGQEYLDGKVGDYVRIRDKEQRIYFKWKMLLYRCRNNMNMRAKDIEQMRMFINNNGTEHSRDGPGVRDWFRSTYSVPYSLFDEGVVDKWLNSDPTPTT